MSAIIKAPNIPVLQVGGRVFTDIKNLICLKAIVDAASTVNSTFRRTGASAGYTPSGTKTFRVLAVQIKRFSTTAAATGCGKLLYSDNDVGIQSATAYTNPVYPGGTTSLGYIGNASTVADSNLFEEAVDFVMPNAKYLGFSGLSEFAACTVWGYEE